MITAVPLLFEVGAPTMFSKQHTPTIVLRVCLLQVKRESLLEDLERVQINSAIAQGSTPQELAQQGMNAIEPPVLKK